MFKDNYLEWMPLVMYPNLLSGNILQCVSVLRMMKGNGIFKKRDEIIAIKRDSYLEHKKLA